MCGVSLKDRKSAVELRKSLGIDDVSDVVSRRRLMWFGHVERKDPKDWVAACRELKVTGVKGKGRPKKTLSDCVAEDMKKSRPQKGRCTGSCSQEKWHFG